MRQRMTTSGSTGYHSNQHGKKNGGKSPPIRRIPQTRKGKRDRNGGIAEPEQIATAQVPLGPSGWTADDIRHIP